MDLKLETIDLIIMVIYAIFIIVYGLYHAKRNSSEEYFLAGRDMTWPVVGISLFAANISSSTLVGLASSAYQTDTHVFNYEWLAAVVLVFFAIFFLPFYLKSRVYTMPEYLERRYDARSRYYFSFITIVGNVVIDSAAAMYVGLIILKLMFPEMSSQTIVIILAFAAAAYTVPGGLNSVIQTEVIQAILLILGSILLTYFALEQVGGWSGMIAGLDAKGAAGELLSNQQTGPPKALKNAEEVLSMVRPAGDGFMPWTGLLFGAPILGFYFWANNQFMVQRVLGAKNINHGRWGALFAGLLKLPVIFIMVIPGTIAILLYSDLDLSFMNYMIDNPSGGEKIPCANLSDCPNATYPLLLFKLLPNGLLGLVLAGLLAAMMSSISATFNSASTLFTMDFVQKNNPSMSSDRLVRVGQITTLFLVVLAAIWAPQIERFGSLWEYLQIVLSYIAPPVAATFLVGLFMRRANGNGSIAGLLTGFFIAALMVVASVMEAYGNTAEWITFLKSIHFLHFTTYLFIICSLVVIIVSLMTQPPKEVFQRNATNDDVDNMNEQLTTGKKLEGILDSNIAWAKTGNMKVGDIIEDKLDNYVWKKSIFTSETEELKDLSWYLNYRYQSIILLIITAILVGYFW